MDENCLLSEENTIPPLVHKMVPFDPKSTSKLRSV